MSAKAVSNSAWAARIHEQEANCMSTRGSFQLSRFALGKNGVGRIVEISDRLGLRHQFKQQFKALSSHFGPHEVNAGDRLRLSTRPIRTGSAACIKTIGIVWVAALAASAPCVL